MVSSKIKPSGYVGTDGGSPERKPLFASQGPVEGSDRAANPLQLSSSQKETRLGGYFQPLALIQCAVSQRI